MADEELTAEGIDPDLGAARKCKHGRTKSGKCRRKKRGSSPTAPAACRQVLSEKMTGAKSRDAKSSAMHAYHNCLYAKKHGGAS